MTLSYNYSLVASAIANTATDTGSQVLKHLISQIDQYGDGTGSREVQKAWSDTRTLVATSEDLDLNDLTNPDGQTVDFSKINTVYIRNNSAEGTGILMVGGNAVQAWAGAALLLIDVTDKIGVKNQGFIFSQDPVGMAVAAGDLLKIDSGAATISYTIVLIGT